MDNVRFWDKMSAGYDAMADGKYAQAYADTVALTRKYLKPADAVLDFACGTGLVTAQLAGDAASIHGLDLSPGMLDKARARCEAQGISNVTFTAGTLMSSGLADGSFDVVLAFNILHGLPDAAAHCAHIRRLLKPGGLFLSVTDCLKEGGFFTAVFVKVLGLLRAIPHVNILSQRDVTALVEGAGFEVLESRNLFESPPNLFIAAQKP